MKQTGGQKTSLVSNQGSMADEVNNTKHTCEDVGWSFFAHLLTVTVNTWQTGDLLL